MADKYHETKWHGHNQKSMCELRQAHGLRKNYPKKNFFLGYIILNHHLYIYIDIFLVFFV